jgi:transposase InsO family protein
MSKEKPRKTDVYLWYKAAHFKENAKLKEAGEEELQRFGRTAFFNIIDSFPAYDVMVAREGEDYALKHFAPIIRSYETQMPGKEVELDCVKMDMMSLWARAGQLKPVPKKIRKTLKKIRIWFVVVIDRATRYVLAIKALVNPSGQGVLDAIRMTMTDKTLVSELVSAMTPWAGHCLPREVIFDNGDENIVEEVTASLQALGITVTKPPAGAAADRPFVESLFRIIVPLFTAFFAGRTFASIKEKGEYKPAEHASLFIDEFVELCHLGICDIYHNRPHGSLGGRSPHNAWWQACHEHGFDPAPGPEEMLRAFGKPEALTLDQYGIKRIGLSYRNADLDREYGDEGRVKVDILVDSSRINDILVKGKLGWLLVENQNGLLTDMTEAEWSAARAADLAANDAESEPGLGSVYSAVNRLRASGEAARLRADMSPMRLSEQDRAKRRRQLFSGYEPAPQSGSAVPVTSEIIIPRDELRDGTVSPVARVVDVDAAPVAPTLGNASKFNRKWED